MRKRLLWLWWRDRNVLIAASVIVVVGILAAWGLGWRQAQPEPAEAIPPSTPEEKAVTQEVTTHTVYLPLVSRALDLNEKGVGVPDGVPCEKLATMGITRLRSWNYNGVHTCPGMASYGCIWNPAMAYQAIAAGEIVGEREVITFNECDMADQCATSPQDAVQAFHDLTAAFPGRDFGLPSTFVDQDWLSTFWSEYVTRYGEAPRVAFVDVHCYHDDAQACIAHVSYFIDFAQRHGIGRVWVTEFQFGHWNAWTGRTDAQAAAEGGTFIAWMENQPEVEAYFWFAGKIEPGEPWYPVGWGIPNLFTAAFGRTVYGEMYAAY